MSDHTPTKLTTQVSSQNDTTSEIDTPLDADQCVINLDAYLSQSDKPVNDLSQLFPDAASIVSHYLMLPTPLLLINSRYWQSAVEMLNQVIPANAPAKYLLSYNREQLFGRVSIDNDQQLDFTNGHIGTDRMRIYLYLILARY